MSGSNAIAVHCTASKARSPLLTVSLRAPDPAGEPQSIRVPSPVLAPDDLVRFFGHKPGGPVAVVLFSGSPGEPRLGVDRGDSDVPAVHVDLRAFPARRGLVAGGSIAPRVLQELARAESQSEPEASGDVAESEDDLELELGERRSPSAICPQLEMLNLEFELYRDSDQRGDSFSGQALGEPALRQISLGARERAVDAHFRSLCAELERVLPLGEKMGTKLSRLGLGCPDRRHWGLVGREGPEAETNITELEPWGAIVERLEKLVDGPVIFHG